MLEAVEADLALEALQEKIRGALAAGHGISVG
jgi:hypothetical protein